MQLVTFWRSTITSWQSVPSLFELSEGSLLYLTPACTHATRNMLFFLPHTNYGTTISPCNNIRSPCARIIRLNKHLYVLLDRMMK
ncbi:uncharacterized protein N7518_010369 [Penicillium psychrosexuale]|uniref:uncharacterized protein n=1 Tax=Penicillium psychrosexuale TaxID=1002107 RepID=UPI002545994D|nr:uncharacterized protein N7518_010369 [Penicillium psychrosexuale]KAJ5781886.1 hypothetical protein N7518_010369 [Penicillium psychrosexuale]